MLQLWEEGRNCEVQKGSKCVHCQSVYCLVGEANMKANDDEI